MIRKRRKPGTVMMKKYDQENAEKNLKSLAEQNFEHTHTPFFFQAKYLYIGKPSSGSQYHKIQDWGEVGHTWSATLSQKYTGYRGPQNRHYRKNTVGVMGTVFSVSWSTIVLIFNQYFSQLWLRFFFVLVNLPIRFSYDFFCFNQSPINLATIFLV